MLRGSLKIWIKCIVILMIFIYSPVSSIIYKFVHNNFPKVPSCFYKPLHINNMNMKATLNILSYNSHITLHSIDKKLETTKEHPRIVPKLQNAVNKKRIYIYNTHQGEQYQNGKSVMDGSLILAKHLKKIGYDVVVETNDFEKYMQNQGWNYNDLYKVSYKYLNDAIVNYGGFDLMIDFHRDSVPREVSFIDYNKKKYAKVMMVVGGLGRNAEEVKKDASTLTNIMNELIRGIMKYPMIREAYYNQEVAHRVILIEVGADCNTFAEIENSVAILAKGIDRFLNQ